MAVFISIQRFAELYIANRNRRWALNAGGKEFGAGHYPLFFFLHIGWLLGWIGESCYNGGSLSNFWYLWLSLFFIAQMLRYWCMLSLGRFWNTRIIVIPGEKAVLLGPYRFIRHPNYLAVVLELISVPLIFSAAITASIATLLNALLILGIRIPRENTALQLLEQKDDIDAV